MDSVTHRRWVALGELMLSHLCPLWILFWFSPTFQTPTSCIIKSSVLSWSDSHAAVYTAHPPAPALLRPLFTFGKQLQVLRQRTGFLAVCPRSLSSSTPTRCVAVRALWGPFSPLLSVHIGPSVPEPGSSAQDTEGRRPCHSLPLLQGAPLPSVFPQPSVDALDHLWVPSPAPKLWMQEGASAQRVLSHDPCTCCVFFQDVLPESLRAPVSPQKSESHSVMSDSLYSPTSRTVQSMEFSRSEY